MNGIYGVIAPSGRPISSEELAPMRVKNYFRMEGGGVCTAPAVGLATFPISSTKPLWLEERPLIREGTMLAAAAHLTNREELQEQLSLSLDVPQTDGEIILAAYFKYGAECVEHLEGDWSFALWDSRRKECVLARDATGNTSLYWRWSGKELVFGTSIKSVLAHAQVPHRPNLLAIACIMSWRTDGRVNSASAYEGIQHLRSGRLLTLKQEVLELRRWWRPETLQPLRLSTDQEYYDAFLEVYSAAVRKAAQLEEGCVGVSLSGGLDSGSVFALAASHFSSTDSRLRAYTHAPLYQTTRAASHQIVDESGLAERTAAYAGHPDIVTLRGERASIVQSVRESVEAFDAPTRNAPHCHWIFDLLRTARSADCRVLLTGQGGNNTVSHDGGRSLWPALRSGGVGRLIKEISAEKDGTRSALKQRLLQPLCVPAVPRMSSNMRRKRSAISEAFFRELKLDRLKQELGARTLEGMPILDAARLALTDGPPFGLLWAEYGASCQIEVRDPTRDRRVVEFCWQTPGRIFWSNGLRRGLIRRGLRGRLPEDILLCKGRGQQISDFGARVLTEKDHFLHELSRLQSHPLATRVLDLTKMRKSLTDLEQTVSAETVRATKELLVRGLAIGIFLSRF